MGLFRHIYDTKVFVDIYSKVVGDMVERQRLNNVEGTKIDGRVSLSRELVDVFQMEVPTIVTTLIQYFGAIIKLYIYNPVIGF